MVVVATTAASPVWGVGPVGEFGIIKSTRDSVMRELSWKQPVLRATGASRTLLQYGAT
jgi:hypothetical protein